VARRSPSPARPVTRFKMAWLIGAALVAILAMVAVGMILAFAHGPRASTLIADRLAEALDGEVALSPLAWKPGVVSSPRLTFHGSASNRIAEADLSGIQAGFSIASLLRGEFPLVRISEASITLRPPSSGAQRPSRGNQLAEDSTAGVERVAVERLRLAWDFGVIEDLKADLVLDPFDGTWDVETSGGTASLGPLPPLAIDSLEAELTASGLDVREARLRADDGGNFRVRGNGDSGWNIEWTALGEPFLHAGGVPENVKGRFAGSATIMADGSSKGRLAVEEGAIEGIPRIPGIPATLLPTRLPLEQMETDFRTSGGRTVLSNLRVRAGDSLRAEGVLEIGPGGTLAGRMELGIPVALANSLPGAEQVVFTTRRDGFLWTPVVIGGTLASPTEDLTGRLAALVAGGALLEAAGEIGDSLPAGAGEAARDLIDSLLPLLQ
jgi:hypothetical protein